MPCHRLIAILAIALALPLLTAAAPVDSPAPAGDAIKSVEVVGTRFVVTRLDGRVLDQDELVGAVLTAGDDQGAVLTVRIEGHEADPKDPTGEVTLYRLSSRNPATGAWAEACDADPDGRHLGFPLVGRWTATGEHLPDPASFSITCTAGAIGKCVRFGYKPWGRDAGGASLWPVHQACVRMIRADYCGDGIGNTRNGTPIDIFDDLGIQADEPGHGLTFEAGWTADGAVCVAHPRIPALLPPESLKTLCPTHLADRTGQASCTEEQARKTWGAVLYDRS